MPSIVIKTGVDNLKKTILETVVGKIDSNVKIPISRVHLRNQDKTVMVRCVNKDQVIQVQEALEDELGKDFEVNIEELKCPRIKVIGVQTSMSNTEIERDIMDRNPDDEEGVCKVIHVFTNNKNPRKNVLVELSPNLYANVKANRGLVCIGHQRYRSYDDLNALSQMWQIWTWKK